MTASSAPAGSEPPDGLSEYERERLGFNHEVGDGRWLYAEVERILADRRKHYAAALEGAREDVARAIEEQFAEWDGLGGHRGPHVIHTPGWLVQRAYENAAEVVRNFPLAARLGVHGPTTEEG